MASRPIFLAAVLALYAVAATAQKPQTCRDVQTINKVKKDGTYTVYPRDGIAFRVYCRGMSGSSPTTYLTLPAGGNKNYATVYTVQGRGDTCADTRPTVSNSAGGTTRYSRLLVRMNTLQLTVNNILQNVTYLDVTTTNAIYASSTVSKNVIPYGTAGDMYFKYRNPQCLRGQFRIDLSGTPFAVDSSVTWNWKGKMANAANTPNRNNITFSSKTSTGLSQVVMGMCGGFPGTCTAQVKGQNMVRLQFIGACQPANGSLTPCSNGGTCVGLSATSFRCECATGWTGTTCRNPDISAVTRLGRPSAARDDAQSSVSCPTGYMLKNCSCSILQCDGSYPSSDNKKCIAIASFYNKAVQASAVCAAYSSAYYHPYVKRFPTSAFNSAKPSFTCPTGHDLIGCSTSSPWYMGKYGKGTLNAKTGVCSSACPGRQKYLPKGCFVTATCAYPMCNCKNGGTCNPVTGQCICPLGYVGTKCERFDYCDYQLQNTRHPVCQAGGVCTGKSLSVVSTVGGDNTGKDCVFPFKFQGVSYGTCITDNQVGPPFACGAHCAGTNDYVDLGSWSPGYELSLEFWFKPAFVTAYRESIGGWFDSCRDSGIVVNHGVIGMAYKGRTGCSFVWPSKLKATTGQWHHVALTLDGSYQTLYINGTQVGQVPTLQKHVPSARGLWLGSESWCNGGCNHFKGTIKMARVYKKSIPGSVFADEFARKPYNITRNVQNNGLIQYFEFGTDAPLDTPCAGIEHGGKDWVISKDGQAVSGIHCNVRNFIIPTGVRAVIQWYAPFKNNSYKSFTGGNYGSFQVFAKNVYIYGTLTANGAGYPGGPRPQNTRQTGYQGFTYQGLGGNSNGRRAGGGGGGYGDPHSRSFGKAGGGGGYGSNGANAVDKTRGSGSGQGGATYGDAKLTTLHLGSGGGSGGNDNALHDNPKGGAGGRGGGAIHLDARETLLVEGTVSAQGLQGQGDTQSSCNACPGRRYCTWSCSGRSKTVCFDYSGPGGGGSGGSIYLRGNTVNVNKGTITAQGGRGGWGPKTCGGNGGVGRVRIDYATLLGDSVPTAFKSPFNETFQNLAANEVSKLSSQPVVYLGCFVDSGNRFFPYLANGPAGSVAGKAMTPMYCYNMCRQKGYLYAGVEYSWECFCGNTLGRYPQRPAGECSRRCPGDNTQFCGGSYRVDVWGPPPVSAKGHAVNGAFQKCDGWCGVGTQKKTATTPARTLYGYCNGNPTATSFDVNCDCPAGKRGSTCQFDCKAGTYGKGCTKKCSCKNGICDPATGKCACLPGWRGSSCSTPCQVGKFGPNCEDTCTCQIYCTPTRCDKNHSAIFEAESGTPGSPPPFAKLTSDKASGQLYLKVNTLNTWSASSAHLIGSYQFNVSIGQEYNLWLRVLSPTTSTDSLFYNFDNQTAKTLCWVSQNPNFTWRKCRGQGALSIGSHTLRLYTRESGLGIDKIFIGSLKAQSSCDAINGSCTCNPGFSGPTCSVVCNSTSWGTNCGNKCTCQNDGVCSPLNGHCTCSPGWAGANCDQKCGVGTLAGRYGVGCASLCQCKNGATCNFMTGKCECQAGYTGTYCELPCASGKFGPGCLKSCNCKFNGFCDPKNGTCHCQPGHTGSDCSQTCSAYKYGVDCKQTCSQCDPRYTSGCDHVTGACKCQAGLIGATCKTSCPANKWGPGCSKTCCCRTGSTCNPSTGACGCHNGWQGKCCFTACTGNRWGPNCNGTCVCANGANCNRWTGACLCRAGFTGKDCSLTCNITKPGYYGNNCRSKNKCNSTGTAWYDSSNGKCYCKSGFQGLTCSGPCPANKTGPGCLGSCGCQNKGTCHSVHGTCDCPAGYYGKVCDLTCGPGVYGYNCSQTCACQNGASCNPVDGTCTCTAGYMGSLCDQKCPSGYFGAGCTTQCSPCVYGDCDHQTGACNCWDGYIGQNCSTQCLTGFWGRQCSNFCNCPVGSTCNNTNGQCTCVQPGLTGANCDQNCTLGWFGVNCQGRCPTCNPVSSMPGCDPATGKCICRSGYTGPLCSQSCPAKTWGDNCTKTCVCLQGNCYPTNGTCVCKPGYMGSNCNIKCPVGTFGQDCLQTCLCNHQRDNCSAVDGTCSCGPGFVGAHCQDTCPSGYFGLGCASQCGASCDSRYGVCDHVNGMCHCLPGYMGTDCSTPCPKGKWGLNCNETCSCVYGSCDPKNGHCTCTPGWTGPNCNTVCTTGSYGLNCGQTCTCKNNATCDPVNGNCACQPGWVGHDCDQACGPGLYGHLCYQTCICKNGATCDKVTGFCNCAPGWAGLDCGTPCPAGRWGAHCSNFCPNCVHQSIAGTCNSTTGKCVCDPGWNQPNCSSPCPDGYFGDCTQQCPCTGAGSVCVKSNGTCLCGPSHRSCKFGACNSQGVCICEPGYVGDNCTQACNLGKYGTGCARTCNCDANAICNNVNGSCSCPGVVTVGGQQMPCNGRGTCSSNGKCQCSAGWQGASCDTPCDVGKYGVNCASSCTTQCGSQLVCSPVDGSCVAHCSSGSGDYCKNNGICIPSTGVCNCTGLGWTGPHCTQGSLSLQITEPILQKTDAGNSVELQWKPPTNVAQYAAFELVYQLTLTDNYNPKEPVSQTFVTTYLKRTLLTVTNHPYTLSVVCVTSVGAGQPVTLTFTAGLQCPPGDGSIQCRYHTCGKCSSVEVCDSKTSTCRTKCTAGTVCLNGGTCDTATAQCQCTKEWGGFTCDVPAQQIVIDHNGDGQPVSSGSTGSQNTSSSDGLSSGAVIGIVIGVILIIAVLCLVVGYMYIQRIKRRQHAEGGPIDTGTIQADVKYDSSGQAVGFSNPVYASTKSPVKDNPMYESSEILKDTDPPASDP